MNLSLIHVPSAEIFGKINELECQAAELRPIIMMADLLGGAVIAVSNDEAMDATELLSSIEMHRDYLRAALAERN